MRKATIWTLAALTAVMVATSSNDAAAFCHKYRSVPVWMGAYYPNCGPCGSCLVPYVSSGCYAGFGYCGSGCGSCGVGGCGYGSCGLGGCGGGCGYGCANRYCGYGCGPRLYHGYTFGYGGCGTRGCYSTGCGCVKKHHGCLFAHKAWKRYLKGGGAYCGDGCGDSYCGEGGCGDGSCGTGSCGTGSCGEGGCVGGNCGGDQGQVISDGPADDAPATPTSDQSAGGRRPLMLLTALHQGDGQDSASAAAAFEKGLTAFRRGSMNDASRDFELACTAEPSNAYYHYYRALALFDLVGAEGAGEALQQAIQAERSQPVSQWGKKMERVQGRSRVWVEKARRDAGLVR